MAEATIEEGSAVRVKRWGGAGYEGPFYKGAAQKLEAGVIESVGILVERNERVVVLAAQRRGNGLYQMLVVIPAGSVIEVVGLAGLGELCEYEGRCGS